MKRMILAGVVALTAGLAGLLAQTAAAPAAATGPMPKSPDELKAVQAIGNAPTPDEAIKASEDLLTNYKDTEFKEYAYTMEARAYQQKRDRVNAEVYGERALQIDPKAFMMELLVGEIIAPNIKDHDLDRDQEIAKANHLFTDAIANIQTATKPSPQISDKDWDEAKKFATAQAHNDLGILDQVQKKWDDAVKEYQMALDGDPEQDAYATRLANAYVGAGKNDQAIAICDKLLAKPDLNPTIKQVLTSIKTQATKK